MSREIRSVIKLTRSQTREFLENFTSAESIALGKAAIVRASKIKFNVIA